MQLPFLKSIIFISFEYCNWPPCCSSMSKGISGGQAKRVNIGIALVTNPRVLFLGGRCTAWVGSAQPGWPHACTWLGRAAQTPPARAPAMAPPRQARHGGQPPLTSCAACLASCARLPAGGAVCSCCCAACPGEAFDLLPPNVSMPAPHPLGPLPALQTSPPVALTPTPPTRCALSPVPAALPPAAARGCGPAGQHLRFACTGRSADRPGLCLSQTP